MTLSHADVQSMANNAVPLRRGAATVSACADAGHRRVIVSSVPVLQLPLNKSMEWQILAAGRGIVANTRAGPWLANPGHGPAIKGRNSQQEKNAVQLGLGLLLSGKWSIGPTTPLCVVEQLIAMLIVS